MQEAKDFNIPEEVIREFLDNKNMKITNIILAQKNCPYELLEKETTYIEGIRRIVENRNYPLPNELAVRIMEKITGRYEDEDILRKMIYYNQGMISKSYSYEFFKNLILKARFLYSYENYNELVMFSQILKEKA